MVDTILVEECQNEVFIKKFEQIVLKYPKNIAVKYKHHALTYLQLNTETNKLATYLQSKYKISHNELIGIMADRSETMVIGILAILKCGCAFVPIEPNGSHERFHFVCSDTAIKLVLFNIPESKLPSVDGVEFIDLNNNKNYQGKGFNLDIPIKLEDIAYVMYTSGSTGIPKGVLIKNENLVNFIAGFIKSFNVNNNDTFLQISNFLFDSCISEIFVPLTCGGCVVIPEKGIQSYPERVINNIHENGVSIIFFTPVMLQLC